MAQPVQPRAAFLMTVTQQEYVAAALVASRLTGRLHTMRRVVPVGVVLVVLLAWLCRTRPPVAVGVLIAGLLLWTAAALAARRSVESAAERDHAVFAAVLTPTTVTLWEDSLELSGEQLLRRDPYGCLSLLGETAALFVPVREDGTFVVLPKRAMPVDSGRAATFLRNTFARKYRRLR